MESSLNINELENTVIVHDQKIQVIENELETQKDELVSLRPKRVGLKTVLIIIPILLTILGGWGSFSSKMADKPSRSEVQVMLKPNTDALQKIQDEQIKHRALLEKLEQHLTDQGDVLKDIQSRIK